MLNKLVKAATPAAVMAGLPLFFALQQRDGTSTAGDIVTRTLDGRNLNDIWAEFQQALADHNANRDRLISLLTHTVNRPVEQVPVVRGGAARFQEASEFGEPTGARAQPELYELAYDFSWYDLAMRYTWKFLAESEAGQVESMHNQALLADRELMLQKVLEAFFDNSNRTVFVGNQSYTAYPFYNGDGTVPPPYKGREWQGDETHYITNASSTIVGQDVVDLYSKLTRKGYGDTPGMAILLLVNEQQADAIRGFDRNQADSPFDFIPIQEDLTALDSSEPLGDLAPTRLRGVEPIGRYGKAIVVEENWIPEGYMVAIVSDGDDSVANPIGIREHENADLRGMRLIRGRANQDYPLIDSFYGRAFGTGVRHRGAGAVMQVTTNSSYTPPAEYTREW